MRKGKTSWNRRGGSSSTASSSGSVARLRGVALLGAALLVACGGGGGGGRSSGDQVNHGMAVSPRSDFDSSGPQGGPFSPVSKVYTLENNESQPIDWTVSSFAQVTWMTISPTTGQLAPGEKVDVTLTLNSNQLAALPAGTYPAIVDFVNETSGRGTTTRTITLTIGAVPGLDVTPTSGLQAFGVTGGPFSPASKSYTLTNSTTGPLDWSASADQSWVTLSNTGGTLAAGAQVTVDVTIDQAAAASFPVGSYLSIVTFLNLTTGAGDTTRDIRLDVTPPGSSGTASSLTQFGITWDFDQPYTVGQFVNGDWWVVGPVAIIGITPQSTDSGGRTRNGSMVNPSPQLNFTQGYDSAMYGIYAQPSYYDSNLNVALGVSPSSPLILQPHRSLISTRSDPNPGARPQLLDAAVLTVLPGPAPPGSFRPPYCGSDKTIKYNDSNLDPNQLLQSLSSAGFQYMPELPAVERMFERPWIAHVPLWYGPSYMHPKNNLPNYGREIADAVGIASLMLNLDFTPQQKRKLLIRFIQVGIDFYGILDNGGRQIWQAGAGFNHGRKWPILFAGLMLDDPDMSGVGLDPTLLFQGEDGQTFYVQETSPGVYNNGYGGYGPQHVGMPEWGIKHSTVQSDDDVSWQAPYRECCTANAWYGEILSARIMPGVKALWNHDALFDYQDRYLQTTRSNGSPRWIVSWTRFPLEVWDRYRSQF